MNINPREIRGNWNYGWALDVHTLRSVPLGPNEWGHEVFDTTRSEIGEAIYKLKYKDDRTQIDAIADTVAAFVRTRPELADVGVLLAVPPSNTARRFQPVPAIVTAIGTRLGIPVPSDYLRKTKPTTPLKDMSDKRKRHGELEGAFTIEDERYKGQHMLIFDDLFRSGETLTAICAVLISQGKVGKISVIAATFTRSKR
jgi:predicted amidophosphoribosyltransferase